MAPRPEIPAALFGDPGPEPDKGRIVGDLAGDERLAQREVTCGVEQARRDEGERLGQVREICR